MLEVHFDKWDRIVENGLQPIPTSVLFLLFAKHVTTKILRVL